MIGATGEEFKQRDTECSEDGYAPDMISAYELNGIEYFNALYSSKGTRTRARRWGWGMSREEFDEYKTRAVQEGFSPLSITVSRIDNKDVRFHSVWEKDSTLGDVDVRVDDTAASLGEATMKLAPEGHSARWLVVY